jgi:hypothetical protein
VPLKSARLLDAITDTLELTFIVLLQLKVRDDISDMRLQGNKFKYRPGHDYPDRDFLWFSIATSVQMVG